MAPSLFKIHRHPKVIAHRGNSAQAPENTFIAFRQAIKLQVDFLECDVQLSKDSMPVVIHDGTFHRITNNFTHHSIDELDLEEIRQIDAGSWFDAKFSEERILTLKELLCLPRGKIGLMLDIKEETVSECGLAKVVGDIIVSCMPFMHQYGPVLVGSLNPQTLLCLKAYLPEQQFIPIIGNLDHWDDFRSIDAMHYAIKDHFITSELINLVHRDGAEIWAWTVDDKSRAAELIELGIDGLITNHPKKMMALHERRLDLFSTK